MYLSVDVCVCLSLCGCVTAGECVCGCVSVGMSVCWVCGFEFQVEGGVQMFCSGKTQSVY